jgi:cytochrome c oxidase subunit 1
MTIAFMGFAYYLVPLLTKRRLWGGKLATVQAYGYSAGLTLLIVAQTWAGILGVPRRTQSSSYGEDLPAGWDASMNLNGVGAALAAATGGLFIVIMVMTLLAGKKTDVPEELVPAGTK